MPSISAVAGKSLTLKCPVAGYPIDSIVWEKGNRNVNPLGALNFKIKLNNRWCQTTNKYVTTCLQWNASH